MAVELAVAYVQLLPSAQGIGAKIAQELSGPLEQAAKETGEKVSRTLGDRIADGMKKAGAVGGVALSTALGAGFANNVSMDAGNDKLQAQLGSGAERAGDLGKIAGHLYASNFGDNLGQVNEALRASLQGGLLPEDATNKQIESVTAKVLGLASTFDQDLGGAANAAGQLIRTGLVKNADEALDVITRGFQQGANSRGDLLDTLTEYGTQFRKLGIDGPTAIGLIQQGLRGGARDADIVADAFKEFAIRAVDGSKTTADGFARLGLNADQMAAAIAKGGPSAAGALDQVLDRMRALPSDVARNQTVVDLFGTQFEDLGDAVKRFDPSTAAAGLGKIAGAADEVNQVVGDNMGAKLETIRRRFEVAFSGAADAIGPVLAVAPGLAGVATVSDKLGGVLGKVGKGFVTAGGAAFSGVKSVASWALQTGVAAAKTTAHVAALVAQRVAAVAAAGAQKAMTAAQWALNVALDANPIGLIVIALAALVAGVVIAYKKVGWFRDLVDAAFGAIKAVIGGVIDFVKNNWPLLLAILTGPIGLAVLAISKNWDTIKRGITAVKDWVFGRVGDIVGFVTGIPGRIAGVVSTMWNGLRDSITTAKNWVGDRISDIVGFFTGLPGRMASAAKGMFDGIKEAFKSAINWVIRAWNRLEFKIPGFDPPGPGPKFGGFTLGVPNIPTLHSGGIVPGRPGEEVLALLQAGELVTPADKIVVPPTGSNAAGWNFGREAIVVNGRDKPEATARDVILGFRKLAYHTTGSW